MKNEDLYNQIHSALEKNPQILAAYVVGSTISGNVTSKSDFDLVVIVPNRKIMGEDKVYELIRHLEFPRDLDLSVADRASSPIFLYQIITKGLRIYKREDLDAGEFEAFVLHNYYDTAHIRNIYNIHLKEKFLHAN